MSEEIIESKVEETPQVVEPVVEEVKPSEEIKPVEEVKVVEETKSIEDIKASRFIQLQKKEAKLHKKEVEIQKREEELKRTREQENQKLKIIEENLKVNNYLGVLEVLNVPLAEANKQQVNKLLDVKPEPVRIPLESDEIAQLKRDVELLKKQNDEKEAELLRQKEAEEKLKQQILIENELKAFNQEVDSLSKDFPLVQAKKANNLVLEVMQEVWAAQSNLPESQRKQVSILEAMQTVEDYFEKEAEEYLKIEKVRKKIVSNKDESVKEPVQEEVKPAKTLSNKTTTPVTTAKTGTTLSDAERLEQAIQKLKFLNNKK